MLQHMILDDISFLFGLMVIHHIDSISKSTYIANCSNYCVRYRVGQMISFFFDIQMTNSFLRNGLLSYEKSANLRNPINVDIFNEKR